MVCYTLYTSFVYGVSAYLDAVRRRRWWSEVDEKTDTYCVYRTWTDALSRRRRYDQTCITCNSSAAADSVFSNERWCDVYITLPGTAIKYHVEKQCIPREIWSEKKNTNWKINRDPFVHRSRRIRVTFIVSSLSDVVIRFPLHRASQRH